MRAAKADPPAAGAQQRALVLELGEDAGHGLDGEPEVVGDVAPGQRQGEGPDAAQACVDLHQEGGDALERLAGLILVLAAGAAARPAGLAILLAGALGDVAGLDAAFGGLTRSGSASELTTLTGRTEIWSVAADLIGRRPLLGWGYNGTEQLIADSVPTSF